MNNYKIIQEKVLGNNPRIQILGITVDVLDAQNTIELVKQYIEKKVPLHLMGVNADKINEAKKNPKLMEIINSCGIINADGASVIMAGKFLRKPLPERVAGIDLMQQLIAVSEKKGYGIYLLGARQNVVDKTAAVLRENYPELNIVGIRNGYFTERDWADIANDLRSKKPDIVFVGITSPLKEYLIEYLQYNGINTVFMGVGGSFDVISGMIPRAPLWMQKHSLEWLFRVIQEPKRLFKRYFVGNIIFLKAVVMERFSK